MVRWWILMSALQDLEPWRTHRWGCLEGIFRDVCWSREDPLSTYGEHYPVIWNKMGKAGRQPGASIYFSLPGYLIVSPPPLPRWILAPPSKRAKQNPPSFRCSCRSSKRSQQDNLGGGNSRSIFTMACVTSESPVRREAHVGSMGGPCFRGSFY